MISSILVLTLAVVASASTCGHKPFNLHDTYVVGGHDARPGAWPWQASLQLTDDRNLHFCGGSLIHPEWILTAAHCVDGKSTGEIRVVLGEQNLGINEGTEQIISPAQIIVHEQYKQGGWMHNDVALIKLSRPAELNQRVNLVCLPSPGEDEQGNECFISGWGYTRKTSEVTGIAPKILQEVSGPIWHYADCKKIWGQYGTDVNPKVYCFGNTNGQNYGVCNGDSGGPMSCPSALGWKVVGVAHFAETRCKHLPGAYTKVEPYLDWIKAKVSSGGESPNPNPTSEPDDKTVAPPKPGNPFECSGPGDRVGVLGDCSDYVICTSATGGAKVKCSPRMIFDIKNKGCDYPNRVFRDDCKGNPFECFGPGDRVGVLGDCSAYVICTSATGGAKVKCSPRMIFDIKNKGCDYPHRVKRDDCN